LSYGKKERPKEAQREVILRHDSLMGVRRWKEKDQEIVRNLERKKKRQKKKNQFLKVDNMSRRNN
jgi:hypothetical protein